MPIIGNLFKSKAERAERTELMVLITPRLVRPLDPDEVPPLPTNARPFLPGYDPGTSAEAARRWHRGRAAAEALSRSRRDRVRATRG